MTPASRQASRKAAAGRLMLTKMKLVCESVALNPICSNALTVKAFTDGIAARFLIDVRLVAERGGRRGNRRQVDGVRHPEVVQPLDRLRRRRRA